MEGDQYSWNIKGHNDRIAIESFLSEARLRIDHFPGRIPFNSKEGNLVLGWLAALVDRKPSELRNMPVGQ